MASGSGLAQANKAARRSAPTLVGAAIGVTLVALLLVMLPPAPQASAQSVVAWGSDSTGQLGNGQSGPTTRSDVPVAVCAPVTPSATPPCPGSRLEGVTEVSAGGKHSIALLPTGNVVSWGSNKEGALGIGSITPGLEKQPVYVCTVATIPCPETMRLTEVVQISAGEYSNVALLASGRVVTWGSNKGGQLGFGKPLATLKYSTLPVEVCAVGPDNSNEPGPCPPLEEIGYVSSAPAHAVALTAAGRKALSWGADKVGQLGWASWYPTQPGVNTPEEVCGEQTNGLPIPLVAPQLPERAPACSGSLSRVIAVSFGQQHNLAEIRKTSAEEEELNEHFFTIVAWGYNNHGQLGDGENNGPNLCAKVGPTSDPCADVPVPVCAVNSVVTPPCGSGAQALQGVRSVAAGGSHSLAVASGATVAAWGEGQFGTIGNGSTSDSNIPTNVCEPQPTSCTTGSTTELLEALAVSAGEFHNLALLFNGDVVAWGENQFGQLGDAQAGTSSAPETCGGEGCSKWPTYVCEVGYAAAPPCPAVDRLEGVTRIAAGLDHSVALGSFPVYPSWFKKGIELPKGGAHVAIPTSGSLTLQTQLGPVKCTLKDSEELWNPLNATGEDEMTAMSFFSCTSKLCPANQATELLAESLPWQSHLLPGPPIRDQIENVHLTVRCGGTTVRDSYSGTLTPEVGEGYLGFGSGSGELEDGNGGHAHFTGNDLFNAMNGKITAH